ncbi:MAG: class I SAM-dependent methyltransferase [Thermaurantiacus sp.]
MPSLSGALRHLRERFLVAVSDRRQAFQRIHDGNLWGTEESVSGPGSHLAATESIRRELPELVKALEVQTLLDAPCGDLNWMRHILAPMGIAYIGADLVPRVVETARTRADWPQARFLVLDIVEDPLPAADLWLCRDCLFHLSNADVFAALENFVRSGIPYLLTTIHTGPEPKNRDIRSGGFRWFDLFQPPFNVPGPPVHAFDDFEPGWPPRRMACVTREQVAAALARRG